MLDRIAHWSLLFDMPMRLVILCGVLWLDMRAKQRAYRCSALVKPFILSREEASVESVDGLIDGDDETV